MKGKHRGVCRRLEMKVLDRLDSTRQEKTNYERAPPYMQYDPTELYSGVLDPI